MRDELTASKSMGAVYNVTVRVLDRVTRQLVSEHIGHNQATNTLLTGIAHYLHGDGILNQADAMLSQYIPKYISLGTMGLLNQNEDENGLPVGIGVSDDETWDEEQQFTGYMQQVPGYGADGYDPNDNNGRPYLGLGPMYSSGAAVNCELISDGFLRVPITYRTVVPQEYAELPETVDVVFSAMISTGALAKFRNGLDHIFITETGLWNSDKYHENGTGLLAGYRIIPSSSENWDMSSLTNRIKLKQSILRVGRNQVVQIIWKIQLGSIEQFGGYVEAYRRLKESIHTGENRPGGTIVPLLSGVLTDLLGTASPTNYIDTITGHTWEQGRMNGTTGEFNVASTSCLRCQDYFEVPNNDVISFLTIQEYSGYDLKYFCSYYDENKTYLGADSAWRLKNTPIPRHATAKYYRFVMTYNESVTLTPENLTRFDLVY